MVDVSPDTAFALNFKSNLLGEIDKITASNSQTITLPKTPKNRRILGNAGAPAAQSPERYTKMPARYVRDGVEVVGKAYAVLLSAGEGYEVAIYWGLMTSFTEWVESGTTIGEVCSDTVSVVWSNATPLTTSGTAPMVVADYWNGVGSYGAMGDYANLIALHPFVRCSYILQRIESVFGLSFNYSAYVGTRLLRMGVLCATRNEKAAQVTSGEARLAYDYLGADYMCAPVFTAPDSSLYTIETDTFSFGGVDTPVGVSCIVPTTAGTLTLNVAYTYKVSGSGSVRAVLVKKNDEGTTLVSEVHHTIFEGYIITTPGIPYTVEVEAGDKVAVCFIVEGEAGVANDYEYSSTISFTPPSGDVVLPYGGTFYAQNNLPDITTVQFVKDLCAMLGLQAMPDLDNPTTIRLISLEELEQKKAEAVDWTPRLLDGGGGEPASISYTVDGYAKRNIFAYDNDEEVTATTNGELLVASDNIEEEIEVVSLKWSASNETVLYGSEERVASIPLYSVEQDNEAGNSAELQSVGPRIVWLTNNAGALTYKAVASPLYWGNLLSYYAPLQNILTNAVVIEESVRLTAYDLKTLDFTRPIYLAQYGRYYALQEVKTEGNDEVCKVVLVQLGGWVVNTTVEEIYLVDEDDLQLVDNSTPELELTAEKTNN